MSSYKKLNKHRKREAKERAQRQKEFEQQNYFMFWIKSGEEKKVILLDDSDSIMGYHILYRGMNNRPVHYQCLALGEILECTPESLKKAKKLCPFCRAGIKLVVGMVYTALTLSKWTDKKGRNHKGYRGLLVVCGPQSKVFYNEIQMLAKKNKTLAGTKWEVSRSEAQNSPRIGDTWIRKGSKGMEFYKERYSIPDYDAQPYDYEKQPPKLSKKEAARVAQEYKEFQEASKEFPF